MVEVEKDVRRVTFPLPFGLDHVHCYLLRSSSGGWTLVDTGLGTREPEARWQPVLDELDAPIERVVVTHMHPDHVGGARDVAAITGAPVLQGREDYLQCRQAWGRRDPDRWVSYWLSTGMPESFVQGIVEDAARLTAAVHWFEDPEPLEPGDDVDGWRVEQLRGHADGHIVLLRDGVLIAGDVVLTGITPTIGVYADARPDPLGDYFETLARLEELAPRVAYSGHRDPVLDPAARAREIRSHHMERLQRTIEALGAEPVSAYAVSLALFDEQLSPPLRRFATAEALAHLERLVCEGVVARVDGGFVRA
jgi:glyoxylase-like metal-dependent hydrolase (beta-lactamase superfamily II)